MGTGPYSGLSSESIAAIAKHAEEYAKEQQKMRGAPPEESLSEAFKRDLGVTIDPQALRIFIRWRWDRVQKLAHAIHDGETEIE